MILFSFPSFCNRDYFGFDFCSFSHSPSSPSWNHKYLNRTFNIAEIQSLSLYIYFRLVWKFRIILKLASAFVYSPLLCSLPSAFPTCSFCLLSCSIFILIQRISWQFKKSITAICFVFLRDHSAFSKLNIYACSIFHQHFETLPSPICLPYSVYSVFSFYSFHRCLLFPFYVHV